MPDLGNLTFSASLTVTRCPPTHKSLGDPLDPGAVKAVGVDCNWDQNFRIPCPNRNELRNSGEVRVARQSKVGVTMNHHHHHHHHHHRTKKASHAKSLEDHVRDWVGRKKESGAPESRCFLPFLVGEKKMVGCLVCRSFIYPGEGVFCSVRGCQGVYHATCVKDRLGICNLKKFKCPQHVCFICKQKLNWRCVRCTVASHTKCAPWPDEVRDLKDQPGQAAVCWRHPTDWRLDGKNAASTSNIEEIFCRLPLPYTDEEFKIEFTWKDTENKMEPPPYVHIKRNIYLVKKKRDDAGDGTGCTSCSSTSECSEDCVCRVQCISCSKACHCSENCKNRPFRKDKKIKLVKTEHCGWGVEAAEPINKDNFVIEYIGEVIDDALCEKRLWDMKGKGVHNFYMCEIRKDFTIDATYKGNLSRFLNHSCDPNCVLEKWQVEGETRVGVFAARSIAVGEPLTYDYRFVQFGPEVRCHCGAPTCQGYLGTKKKIERTEVAVEHCWGSKRKRSKPHNEKSNNCIVALSNSLSVLPIVCKE